MRRFFVHQIKQMMPRYRGSLIITLLVLFSPTTGWAHDATAGREHKCGPEQLVIQEDSTTEYTITGPDKVLDLRIVEEGNPLVATLEPPPNLDHNDLVFKVTGTGLGTARFQIFWRSSAKSDTCPLKVTVYE